MLPLRNKGQKKGKIDNLHSRQGCCHIWMYFVIQYRLKKTHHNDVVSRYNYH